MKQNQKAFASIILVVVIVGLIGVVGFFVYQNGQLKQASNQPTPVPGVTPTPSSDLPSKCIVVGCSGTICIDEDKYNENPFSTTCEYKESYGCYKRHSVCKRQSDGKCAWTQNEALDLCLETSKDGPFPLPL